MNIPKRFARAFGALAALLLAWAPVGCKSSARPPTQSGFPEVLLSAGTTVNQVKSVAQEFFSHRGYAETESRHAYEFVFDKPTDGGRKGKALRVRLRLHQHTDGSWRLVGAPMGVEAWRGDLETERVLPQGIDQIQAFLVEIKTRVESGR